MDMKDTATLKLISSIVNSVRALPMPKRKEAINHMTAVYNILSDAADADTELMTNLCTDKIDDLISAYNHMQDMLNRQDYVDWSEEAELEATGEYFALRDEILELMLKGEMFNDIKNSLESHLVDYLFAEIKQKERRTIRESSNQKETE